jgi:hypothetical protein
MPKCSRGPYQAPSRSGSGSGGGWWGDVGAGGHRRRPSPVLISRLPALKSKKAVGGAVCGTSWRPPWWRPGWRLAARRAYTIYTTATTHHIPHIGTTTAGRSADRAESGERDASGEWMYMYMRDVRCAMYARFCEPAAAAPSAIAE